VGNLFNKKTIKDVNLAGKRVLLRADYNVPIVAGKITDDYRLRQSLPTIRYILDQKPAALFIISHLGRPSGPRDTDCSLKPLARDLGTKLDRWVEFAPDCVGEIVAKMAADIPAGGIMLLQNLRFHPGEEKNDPEFAKQIVQATRADVFVQDGFGVVHRAHASTSAITKLLPSVSGLLLKKEVETIHKVMLDPDRPFMAVVGGAKISDKIDVLDKLLDIADGVAVGGALANTFLLAEKFAVGQSLVEAEAVRVARDVLDKAREIERKRNFSFLLPVDVVVAKTAESHAPTRIVDLDSQALADIQSYPRPPHHSAYTVGATEKILDIGPISAGRIAGAISLSRTVVWSGTMGVTETPGLGSAAAPFSHGTLTVTESIIGASNKHANKPFSVVGGGDTVSYVESRGLLGDFNHVSTGGSASLELMAGKKLPGIEALQDK